MIDAPVIEMGMKVDLEKGHAKSNSENQNNKDSGTLSKSKSRQGKKGKDTPIYLLDSQHGVH